MSSCFEKHVIKRPLCVRCGKQPAMKNYDVCYGCFVARSEYQ